jgi:predicted ribosome quality control (RQC) complex YloA/Tae2 family protein
MSESVRVDPTAPLHSDEGLTRLGRSLGPVAAPEFVAEKDRFTSLDALAVAREIQSTGRMFIDKVFDARPDVWELALRAPGTGKRTLSLAPGRYAALRSPSGEHPAELGPLTRELRRHLGGAALVGATDSRGERSLELLLRRGDSEIPLRLITEFFSPGNLLLVREEKIVAVAHPRTWAHRVVRVGATYSPPPQRGNPWESTEPELRAALDRSRTDRVRTLAAPLGFGGPVAEELLARAGLAGNLPASEESASAAALIHRAILGLLADIGARPAGYLYSKGPHLLDVEPFPSHRWTAQAEVDERRFATFSEAAHLYFESVFAAAAPAPRDALDTLRRQEDRQMHAIEELEREHAELKGQAEAILTHFAEAEGRIEEARRSGEDKPFSTTVGGRPVTLVPEGTPRASAERLFDEAKRARSKLSGARKALEETRKRIEGAQRQRESRAPGTEGPGVLAAHRARWFERFRWFLSSDGVLVIGGRDAASNDLIVRRYLSPSDVYIHADVHGAPSVVVRHPGQGPPEPSETTLQEAGQWAVSFSKAWRAGHASADAFWATPDQVSKAAGTGEFVARGAWVIHGTRHWLRNLPLELGLGEIRYEGESRWSVAPPSALRTRGRLRWVLSPGEERDRARWEVDLTRELGISRDLLQRLLPPGGISARRV